METSDEHVASTTTVNGTTTTVAGTATSYNANYTSPISLEYLVSTNVAYGKKVFGNSMWSGSPATRAVDGTVGQRWNTGGGLTHSNWVEAWLVVDLGSRHRVDHMWVYDRAHKTLLSRSTHTDGTLIGVTDHKCWEKGDWWVRASISVEPNLRHPTIPSSNPTNQPHQPISPPHHCPPAHNA